MAPLATPTTQATATPPWWIHLGARLVRVMPAARYRTMNWICRRGVPPFIAPFPGSSGGLRFECDLRNVLAREAYFIGTYEPQETAIVKRTLPRGGTFVDVGANWGYFTFLAVDLVGPKGRVLAIEADPRMFGILSRSLALNDAPQIQSVHAAAAAGPGVLRMRGYEESNNNWGISALDESGEIEVPARAVDAMLADAGLTSVDLLKMDIEGAEGFALEGMRDGLARGIYKHVLIELHPHLLGNHGHDGGSITRAFLDAGYRGLTIRHATSDVRRAAYTKNPRAEDFLAPFDPEAPLGSWPHQLWAAPGVAPIFGAGSP